ncbi:GIY-YIG nuclease family protein [Thermohalobacter berrensis]|uniref:GIY-YIG nuclease family protein n=1 Tax=Thermohalobacter berrensis TaxID=99594 RepID=UPI000E727F87|nr:GIY-YIG nuclease family protein [Thermohalobacter berrensis]
MEELKEKIDHLPRKTGVYLIRDKYNNIIYIGKSKNIRKRVKQYFQPSRKVSTKIEQ